MSVLNGWRPARNGILLVIGIIIVAGLVFGALYLVRERGEAARREEAVKLAEEQLQQQADKEVAIVVEEDSAAPEGSGLGAAASGATELPKTGGSADSALAIIALGAVAFTVTAYLGSRRRLRQVSVDY